MIGFARRFGLKIAARGEGHQPFGQAQVCGGIVIDMRSLQQVHTLPADSIEVDAGASWRTVLQASLTYGLAPPVLTKFLGLTVDGTLSIGGGTCVTAPRCAGRSNARAAGRHRRR
jgi:FAD/FMN-containing dehydrogenase